jgi:adenylate cyclase
MATLSSDTERVASRGRLMINGAEQDQRNPEDPAHRAEDDARSRLISNQRARRLRRFWRMLPSAPRCKICTSPFGPPVGPVLRLVGKGRWPGNPAYCGGCFQALYRRREGAEVECTLFFADVRGSTALAETMPVQDFRALMDRFYATASEVLVRHEAVVDKFVGDEVVGIFVPALAGGMHARRAIDAGLDLLRATDHDETPWVPVGIGVNTGSAYVGAVGTAEHVEFTALGDAVNVTARLASAAGRGELLVTEVAARAAGYPGSALEHRSLDLRGKSVATDVLVITVGQASMPAR